MLGSNFTLKIDCIPFCKVKLLSPSHSLWLDINNAFGPIYTDRKRSRNWKWVVSPGKWLLYLFSSKVVLKGSQQDIHILSMRFCLRFLFLWMWMDLYSLQSGKKQQIPKDFNPLRHEPISSHKHKWYLWYQHKWGKYIDYWFHWSSIMTIRRLRSSIIPWDHCEISLQGKMSRKKPGKQNAVISRRLLSGCSLRFTFK